MARAQGKRVMVSSMRVGASLGVVLLALSASSASAQRRGGKKPASSTPPAAAAPAQEPQPAVEQQTAVPAAGSGMVITPAEAGAAGTAGAAEGEKEETTTTTATSTSTSAGSVESGKSQESGQLQKELSEVMDSLVQARARAAVLGKALWKTTVAIKVDNRAEDQVAVRVALWLDGAPVWNGDGSALSDPERKLFSGFIAPGQHVLTYEVEQRARADEKYRYTQRSSLRFSALKERRTELRLVLDDDSDIAEDFADDEEGEYDVRARLQVRAIEPGDE